MTIVFRPPSSQHTTEFTQNNALERVWLQSRQKWNTKSFSANVVESVIYLQVIGIRVLYESIGIDSPDCVERTKEKYFGLGCKRYYTSSQENNVAIKHLYRTDTHITHIYTYDIVYL